MPTVSGYLGLRLRVPSCIAPGARPTQRAASSHANSACAAAADGTRTVDGALPRPCPRHLKHSRRRAVTGLKTNLPAVNPIARAHDHVLASVATTPELRRGPGCAIEAGSGQTAAGSVRFRDAYQWKKEPVLAETRLRNRARPDALNARRLGQRLAVGVVAERIGGRVGYRRVAMNVCADVDRLVDVDVFAERATNLRKLTSSAVVIWSLLSLVLINGGRMSAPTARTQATGRGSPHQRFIGILIFGCSNRRVHALSV